MYKELVLVGTLYLSAIMLPGPSMSLIVSNSILYNKKSSLLSSAGIMFGIAMQSAAVLIGLTLFTQDSLVFTALQFLCSSYLIYLGIRKYFINFFC